MPRITVVRRDLLKSVPAASLFAIIARSALGGPGQKAPSDMLARGVIGTGGRGGAFLGPRDRRVIAVCDVDKARVEAAAKHVGSGCTPYADFRQLLEVQAIDEVCIATPPHWHALISIHAAQAGKDVLCEKPMTKFIREGQAIADAIRRYGRVFQIGTYGRFGMGRLRKLIQSGRLGKPLLVRAGRAQGYNWNVKWFTGLHHLPPQPVPANLDYNLWLGPAPFKPYHPHRVHFMFRCYWDYDGGGLADQGQHHLDPIQYMLDKDDTGPSEVEAVAPWPAHDDACGPWHSVTIRYADDVAILIEGGEWGPAPQPNPFLEGPNGKVWPGGRCEPHGLLDGIDALPDTKPLISFEQAEKTRQPSGGSADSSHRANTLFLLGNIAIRLGRRIRWDPIKQQCIGDDEANRLVDIPMRAPWHLPEA
ncbi:MAG: Gfo/Idh/MocA family oxidoreductase [Planctomycetes bacterium]|nr:Gfo/Idh/MocA family oxidoreductase [Planctomycetota bacterium]